MSSLLEEFRRGFADPAMRHAAMVHLPIAMAFLGVFVSLAAAVVRSSVRWRVLAAVWFLLLAGSAFMATRSGERAMGALPPNLPEIVHHRLEQHEEMGEKVWIFAVAAAGLFLVSLVKAPMVRNVALALGLGAAIGCAGWTALTGHRGGVLVYEHGLGTALLRGPSPEGRPAGRSEQADDDDVAGGSPPRPESPDPRVVFFDQRVHPILAASCQSCHNAVRPKARLDLTSAEGLLRGGRSGEPTVVPGVPEASVLLAVVRGAHPSLDRMPPDEELVAEEIAALERWIREGAVWGGGS